MKAKGFIHLYAGDGKGKTTSAFGLAMRACYYGMKVYVFQFMKDGSSGEARFLVEKCETARLFFEDFKGFLNEKNFSDYKKLSEKLFGRLERLIDKEDFPDILILDEINPAIHYGLIDKKRFLDFLKNIKGKFEVVLTGRYAVKEVEELCALYTEFVEKKHYYKEGIKARKGIEY